MEWNATIGGMLKHGTVVRRYCPACDRHFPIDLEAINTRCGPRWSLWDSFMPCMVDGCTGITWALASTGPGTPFRPLKHHHVWRNLDGSYDILPAWPEEMMDRYAKG